jgi:hypothetical protein
MSDTLNHRLEILYNVLVYDSDQQMVGRPACFTVFERILINQERGALLTQMSPEDVNTRYYECPEKIESKIQFINQKVLNVRNINP